MSDTSEDEFFDACDEVGSPKSVKLPVFVDDETKPSQKQIDGELSLEHFSNTQVLIASTEDLPSINVTDDQDLSSVILDSVENAGITLPDNNNEDTIGLDVSAEHNHDQHTEKKSVECQDEFVENKETIPMHINQLESEITKKHKELLQIETGIPDPVSDPIHEHGQREEEDVTKISSRNDSQIGKSSTIETVVPEKLSDPKLEEEDITKNLSLNNSQIVKSFPIATEKLLQTSTGQSQQEDKKQAEVEMQEQGDTNNKPTERPTDLPGVKEVVLNSSPNSETTVAPMSKPKRPPPPRPKGPPSRPPAPQRASLKSTGKPGKPYISAIDDGLLTPNSTVDNITSEFVEALSKSRSSDSSSPVKRSSSAPVSKPKSKHNSLSGSMHSNSHDEEILSAVIVRNLDTGETMPLSSAAEHCLNPLDLQIMSRTKEFSFVDENSPSSSGQNSGRSSIKTKPDLSDDGTSIASDEINIGADGEKHEHEEKHGKKKRKIKKFIGKSMIKMKSATHSGVEKAVQKVRHARKHDSLNVSSDEESTETSQTIKIKVSQSNKGPHKLSKIRQVQDISVHVGAVWSMKFSHCGRLLATAGQDNVIWVWVLSDYFTYFSDMRSRYDTKDTAMFGSKESSDIIQGIPQTRPTDNDSEEDECPFKQLPFSSYVGHSADVLDLAWSKNYFVLSSSMDKTVRLWHISRKECLCCFQHIDFVTAISFHPRDDRYFLSGSLDGKLRLWNIPEKKVALWNEISSDSGSNSGGALITTVNFCENGKFAVCGTYDGRCIFYDTEHLKYHTQIHVRSSRGRNNKGHKITGIESLVGEHKILVTSNDSRIRLYDLRDLSMCCKYKGLSNLSSQIKASFSHDQKYIICGSEDKSIYIWPTNVPQDMTKLSSLRRDRNDSWESVKAHDAVVTCAIFAPQPQLLIKATFPEPKEQKSHSFLGSKKQKDTINRVLISADFNGEIKVFFTE